MDQSQPLNAFEVIAQSDVLIERGRLEQARDLLARGLKEHPDHAELLYRLAFVEYRQDENSSALTTVRSLLVGSPEHYGGRTLLASLLEENKELADAERVWIELLRDHPEDADAYASYSGLMLRTLHLEKAQRLANEALRLEPHHNEAQYNLALCELIAGRSGDRNLSLEALVRDHSEHLRTSLALVVALQDRGDARGALRISQQLLRSRPTDPHLLELARELKISNHWSMLPLYPIQKWGWAGVAGVWIFAMFALRQLESNESSTASTVAVAVWIGYVIYSWVWPPLLRKLI